LILGAGLVAGEFAGFGQDFDGDAPRFAAPDKGADFIGPVRPRA
jgi:hypothetical protein